MRSLRVGLVLAGGILATGMVWALDVKAGHFAIIHKKNGETISGEIKGNIVQRLTGRVNEGHLKGNGGLYFQTPGKDIELIDEAGVHVASAAKVRYALVGQTQTPDDLMVLETIRALDGGSFQAVFDYSSKTNGATIQIDFLKDNSPLKLPLIGEFRVEDKQGRIIPALEVSTENGLVVVPVDEVVVFKPNEAKSEGATGLKPAAARESRAEIQSRPTFRVAAGLKFYITEIKRLNQWPEPGKSSNARATPKQGYEFVYVGLNVEPTPEFHQAKEITLNSTLEGVDGQIYEPLWGEITMELEPSTTWPFRPPDLGIHIVPKGAVLKIFRVLVNGEVLSFDLAEIQNVTK